MRVSFYTDAPDPLAYACRLVRRARASGQALGVCGPAAVLKRFDALLWSFEPTDFIPHRLGPARVAGEVVLVENAAELPHRQVLLNLGEALPNAAPEFERILEVLGTAPEHVQAGRQRYRAYQALGAKLDHFSAGG